MTSCLSVKYEMTHDVEHTAHSTQHTAHSTQHTAGMQRVEGRAQVNNETSLHGQSLKVKLLTSSHGLLLFVLSNSWSLEWFPDES